MRKLSVKEVRQQLSEVIREAEAGDSTIITRRGEPVAQISPLRKDRPRFPDLTEFRASINVRGKAISDVVREIRDEERF